MSRPDKKVLRYTKRPRPIGRNGRGVRGAIAKGKSDPFIIGLESFAKISAVEGLHLSAEMKRRFREFDREGLSAEARRQRIIAKYGK
jgi:hypothetical protein